MLRVKNWQDFQHYKHRSPPWIKLHRELTNDYAFTSLPDRSKAHLILIWVLAAGSEGTIPYDEKFIASRIGATDKVDVKCLIDAGFLLADGEQGEPESKKTNGEDKPSLGKRPIGDWIPPDELVQRLSKRYNKTPDQMQRYYTELRDYCLRTGRKYADYEAAYRTAVRDNWGTDDNQRR